MCDDDCLPLKNILIVGASYGLGKEIASVYAAQQENIIISARYRYSLEMSAKDIRYNGVNKIWIVPADITIEDNIKFLLKVSYDIFKDSGGFDRVIFNVGQGMQACFKEITKISYFDPVFNINFNALVVFMKYLIPMLRVQCKRAKVIITTCIAATTGIPSWSLLSAMKHAVVAFMDVIAEENKQYFDVNIVYAPIMDTDMQTRLITADGKISGPTGEYRFHPSFVKTYPYYMPASAAAKMYTRK